MWLSGLKRIWTASIARQLMLGIALVHAVLMSIFVFDLVNRQRGFLLQESTSQAQALAQTLAANGTSWILANDFIGLEEIVHSQRRYPGLMYAMFLSPDGKVLAYTEKSQVGRYVDDEVSRRLLVADDPGPMILIDNGALIDAAYPVRVGTRYVGWARVGISRAGIARNLDIVTQDGLVYTFIAIFVGLIFAWLMSRGLTRDIRALNLTAGEVRAGRRDVDFELQRPDELGRLSIELNHMLQRLSAGEARLKNTYQELAFKEERLRFALEGTQDGLWDWDLGSDDLFLSPRCKEMLGCQGEDIGSSWKEFQQLVHAHDRSRVQDRLQEHFARHTDSFQELVRMRHKSDEWRWILARGRAQFRDDGAPYRMVGTLIDITDRKRLEDELARERNQALVTLSSIGDGVITTDASANVVFLNPVAESLTGWTTEEAKGRHLDEVFSIYDEETKTRRANPIERCLAEGHVVGLGGATMLISRSGQALSVEDSAAPIRTANGTTLGGVLVFHDVTEARSLQREMEYRVQHDVLTGLWSRSAFERRLQEITEAALRGDGEHTLIYIDLDQFKVLNDTLGHAAGDLLLKQVATVLRRKIRDADMLCRLGGDEFGLLLMGCPLEREIEIAEDLRESVAAFQFIWQRRTFRVSASLGVIQVDRYLPDRNSLALADLACYAAKNEGRNRVSAYHQSDGALTLMRLEMEWVPKIKEALEAHQFVLYAQRIAPLRADLNKQNYLEILLRLALDDGSVVSPDKFIPAAERYDIMYLIDDYVISGAFDWLLKEPSGEVHVSINLSGESMGHPIILERILSFLEAHPEMASRLCFEVTETAAIGKLADALEFMGKLKETGVSFSLDDFGTGLSSFSYLKTLPVDFVKIDGSFVRNLAVDRVDAAMVRAISDVSAALGIEAIAEFVENDEIIAKLKEIGVAYAQGYAIARPIPLASYGVESPKPVPVAVVG
jgi:diguanylate cyclase (GGDEF)-like protein/PAS domain S-box-containing protein